MKKKVTSISLSLLMVFSMVSGFFGSANIVSAAPEIPDVKIEMEETVTNESARPAGTAYIGDVLTVRVDMKNYNDSLPEDVQIDNSQLEIPLDSDKVEYVNGSAKSLINDSQAVGNEMVYRARDNRLIFMYVSKSVNERMPRPQTGVFEFQVRVKDTAKDKDEITFNLDKEESYIALNYKEDVGWSFSYPVTTVKEFKPLSVKTEPKVDYIEGQDFDPTGGVLVYSAREGSEIEVAMDAPDVSITGYNKNPSTYGKQTLTITYRGEKTTLDVNVAQKEASSISVVKAPSPKPVDPAVPQVNYIEGQDWGILNDGTLEVTYNNGDSDIVPITADMVDEVSLGTPGSANVTVKYLGLKTTYGITIEPKKALSISLKPSSMNLKVGGAFRAADVTVYTKYNNGKTDWGTALTPDMLDKLPDMNTVGTQVLVVTHNGQKADLTINVQDKELVGVELKEAPKPTEFIEGTKFTAQGGKLTLKYDNNTTDVIDIDPSWVTGPKMNVVGPAKALVKYDKYTVEYDVKIVAASVESIEMLKVPKTDYIEGQDLDVTGGTLKVHMNNGTEKTVNISSDMCSGFDSSKPVDNQKVTVTYGGKTTSYNVNIRAKKVTGIAINESPQLEYFVGSKIDMSKGSLTVFFDNGKSEVVPVMNKGVTAEGFDSSKAGTGTVTLKYEGFSVSYDVTYITHENVDKFVDDVSKLNPDNLTLDDKDKIEALRAEYDKLSDLEKGAVPSETITAFNKLVDKMNSLIDEHNKTNDNGGSGTVGKVEGISGGPSTGISGVSYIGAVAVCLTLAALIIVFVAGRKARG